MAEPGLELGSARPREGILITTALCMVWKASKGKQQVTISPGHGAQAHTEMQEKLRCPWECTNAGGRAGRAPEQSRGGAGWEKGGERIPQRP